jgi:cbb3-type cytochrome oxidase subunit 3
MKNMQNNQEFNLELFVKGLKSEDTRNLGMTNSFQWIMWILAPVYFLLFLLRIIEHPEIGEIGFLFFSLGFLAFALLFKSLHKDYKDIDYGIPTMEMLRNVVHRYAFWQTKTFRGIIPALLCALGFSFSGQRLFPFDSQGIRILAAFGTIMIFIFFSAFIGYLIWRKRQKPIRDQAIIMLQDMGD